jgi:hypothetical protein
MPKDPTKTDLTKVKSGIDGEAMIRRATAFAEATSKKPGKRDTYGKGAGKDKTE